MLFTYRPSPYPIRCITGVQGSRVLPSACFRIFLLAAVSAENRPLQAADFVQFAGLYELTPDLNPKGTGLGLLRFYYGIIRAVDMLVGARVPVVAQWSEREAPSAHVTRRCKLASVCRET